MNKKYSLAVLFAVFFLLNALSPCVAQSRVNSKSQQVTRFNWSGSYIAETYAGRTYGGTGVGYEILIKLVRSSKSKDAYYGTLTIDGYQTAVSASITAYAEGKNLIVYYNRDNDSYPSLDFRNGDVVAEVTYTKDKRLRAEWFGDIRDYYANDETNLKKKK